MVVANLWAQHRHPPAYRLTERETIGFLLFDLAQLAALLFLTGGLNNPFALLIVGPVTLAATSLSLRSTLLVGAAGLATISLLGGYHVPLRTEAGELLDLPRIHLMGFWAAIVIATLLLGAFSLRLTLETARMSRALLATQTALAREQKLYDLGGVVAAAAHELGTPLATIKLAASELVEELSDAPDLRADAALIAQQADRCRDILRSMGRAGKDDTHLRAAPFQSVVAEAAEPHAQRAAEIDVDILQDFAAEPGGAGADAADARNPRIRRAAELIHGLRNLVQNSVDFAKGTVWITGRWTDDTLRLTIEDDGPGFAPEVLQHLGSPYLRSHGGRAGYAGMGLGLFISKTLLERTGATIAFSNAPTRSAAAVSREDERRSGAVVEISWPRDRLEIEAAPLAANVPNL